MTERHFEEWELLAFVAEDTETIDPAAVQSHVSECEECSELVVALRPFWERFSDPAVHSESHRQPGAPEEDAIADATALVARHEEEDAIAVETMRVLRAHPTHRWDSRVAALPPELQSAGLVRQLIAEARATYESDPDLSLSVLGVAGRVADGLTCMFALAAQRAAVAKERGNAYRILGRYPEALEELAWAERFLAHIPVHTFDLAFVEWTRSSVLLHMTRYNEALTSARRAMEILRQFGDATRAEQVRIIEAGILYEQGDVEGALRTYHELAAFFANDALTRARIEANIAECEMRLGHGAAVRRHAHTALALFATLHNETEQARVRWTLAHTLLREGAWDEALMALHDVEETFTRLGMKGEAAGVLLDIVEVHALQDDWQAARPLAARAAAQFAALEVPLRLAEAYAYLRDAVHSGTATVDLVKYVRSYVTTPGQEVDFNPPPGATRVH